MDELDIAPSLHMRHDRVDRIGIVLTHEVERALGKDHAEAERGVGCILLEELELGARMPRFPEIGEIKTGRSAAENCDAHQ